MISVVVLTKNEENNIVDCLETLSWCDEIIVIDDYSEDRTVELAKNFDRKVRVVENRLNNDFAAQRNFGMREVKGEWVLFVDADERMPRELAREIKYQISKIKDEEIVGFYIKRQDFLWGKELKYGETGNTKLLRLARKDAGEWRGKVHEEWKVKGGIGSLSNYLLHYPHQSVKEFLADINYYSTLRAKELFNQGIKTNLFFIISYAKGKFILNYFIRQGFRDGVEGLVVAIIMSFHSFLVRGKLWLLSRKR